MVSLLVHVPTRYIEEGLGFPVHFFASQDADVNTPLLQLIGFDSTYPILHTGSHVSP